MFLFQEQNDNIYRSDKKTTGHALVRVRFYTFSDYSIRVASIISTRCDKKQHVQLQGLTRVLNFLVENRAVFLNMLSFSVSVKQKTVSNLTSFNDISYKNILICHINPEL